MGAGTATTEPNPQCNRRRHAAGRLKPNQPPTHPQASLQHIARCRGQAIQHAKPPAQRATPCCSLVAVRRRHVIKPQQPTYGVVLLLAPDLIAGCCAACGGGGSTRALRGRALACTSTPAPQCCCRCRSLPRGGSHGLPAPQHTSRIPPLRRLAAAAAGAEPHHRRCTAGRASRPHLSHGHVGRRRHPAGRCSARGGRRRCGCGGPRAWAAGRRLPHHTAAHGAHLGGRRLRRRGGGRGSAALASPPALRCASRSSAAARRRGRAGRLHWYCICCFPHLPPRHTRRRDAAALRKPQKRGRLLRSSGERVPQRGGGGRVTLPAPRSTATAPVGEGNAAKRGKSRSSRVNG